MTLKEELEILRGEPIQVFTGDPMDIPCIETSDPERLCKHPVVSVHMITYNHEPYIRQAIEGVMMQKTDFEFELVIGEDCSTDKTREICFEYQKRYPDKIRVLWSDQNLYRNPHSAGGNGRRTYAHCRGEFIAICEGDDYWVDAMKLQKQVNIMRQDESLSLCFCAATYHDVTGVKPDRNWGRDIPFSAGRISGWRFFRLHAYGVCQDGICGDCGFIMTATTMIRREKYFQLFNQFEIFRWRLSQGDTTLWLGLATVGNVYYLSDIVSVYRQTPCGACATNALRICIDAQIARFFWCKSLRIKNLYKISIKMIFLMRFAQSIRGNSERAFILYERFRKYIESGELSVAWWRRVAMRCDRFLPSFFIPFCINASNRVRNCLKRNEFMA